MSTDDQIDNIISQSINIIEKEIKSIKKKQISNPLDKMDSDKVTDYLKTLVLVQRDRRLGAKENIIEVKGLTNDELEAAIAEEEKKLKRK